MEASISFFTAVSAVAALGAFVWTLFDRLRLQKTQYALDMIRDWNTQTATFNETLRNAFPNLYEECQVSRYEEALRQLARVGDNAQASPEKTAVVRLLNYFEYVSSAYEVGAADRKTIHASFTGTMVRYYCLLSPFIDEEIRVTGRNPWFPYSRFVREIVGGPESGALGSSCLHKKPDGEWACRRNCQLPDGGLTVEHTFTRGVPSDCKLFAG